MRISLVDRSLYYKGLMLLIRKDHEIRQEERDMMMRIGEMLGFDPNFCKSTIDEIINNKYVNDSAPLFSDPSVTRCFLKDGLKLSAADGQIHETEIQWLESVAKANCLENVWSSEVDMFNLRLSDLSALDSLELKNFQW